MRKELGLGVQEVGDRVGVEPGAERADVKLVELTDPFQESARAWPDPGVIPRGLWAVKLEVIDVFHVRRYVFVGCVNESLVQVNKEN